MGFDTSSGGGISIFPVCARTTKCCVNSPGPFPPLSQNNNQTVDTLLRDKSFLLVVVIDRHNNSAALCPLFTTQLLFATTTRGISDDIRPLIQPFVAIIVTWQQVPGRLTDGHWQIIFRQRMGYWMKWMPHRRLQGIRIKLRIDCLLRGLHCRNHYVGVWGVGRRNLIETSNKKSAMCHWTSYMGHNSWHPTDFISIHLRTRSGTKVSQK